MEFPVEIIYEISCYIPFQSYIWCLSKATKKYWGERSLDLSKIKDKSVNLDRNIDFLRMPCGMDEYGKKIFYSLLDKVKFIAFEGGGQGLDILSNMEKPPAGSLLSINFNGCSISRKIIDKFGFDKLTNYYYMIGRNDRYVVSEYFPHLIGLFDAIYSGVYTYERLYIEKGRLVMTIQPETFNYKGVDRLIRLAENISVRPYYDKHVRDVGLISNICKYKNIKSCEIITDRYAVNRYLSDITKYNVGDSIDFWIVIDKK